MVEPIDLQQTMDRALMAEKLQQAIKDIPEGEHIKFMRDLEKENEKRDTTVNETEAAEFQKKVRDDEENKESSHKQGKQNKQQRSSLEESDEPEDGNAPGQGHFIDIQA